MLFRSGTQHASDPQIARITLTTRERQEQALLRIRVLDYASGSGHILIGAARRLARRLAQIRTGDEEPSPADLRSALRDVIRHCIYGVDINAMAVELCKVALWLETLEPGKPLSFLDHHIQCGNSLVGTGIRGQGTGTREQKANREQHSLELAEAEEIGRASCRERV